MSERADAMALLVEVLGPAGAGKTTLVRTLCASERGIVAGLPLGPLTFAGHALYRLGSFVPRWAFAGGRWFDRREMRSIGRLDAWAVTLRRVGTPGQLATVVDHGPIYRLARLHEFGPRVTQTPPFRRWWRASRDAWMDMVDLVVWLDAPDEVLVHRAEHRGHWFLGLDVPRPSKREFLARYRNAFDHVLDRGESAGPSILRLRTDHVSTDAMVITVIRALDGLRTSSSADRTES